MEAGTVAELPEVVDAEQPARRRQRSLLLPVSVALVVGGGVALRCWTPAHLWLDEALTVNIARLPLRDLPEALRHDGAPPLYYVLLHGWIRLFGGGDAAVRSLSAVLAISTLPVMWFAGRRIGGRTGAWTSVVLLAASPFAIRYATEARMYSMAILLTLLGYLAVMRALEQPRPLRLAAVVAVTTILLFTHYWAVYLVFLAAFGLLLRLRHGRDRAAVRTLAALGAGVALFLPWLPIFLYQLRHTGTPWAPRPGLGSVVRAFQDFGGGRGQVAPVSALMLLALVALGLFGRAVDERRIELDLRLRPRARSLALVGLGTVILGVAVAMVGGAGFDTRHAAMGLPLFVLLAALGAGALADRRVRHGVLAVVAAFGLWSGALSATQERTTAGKVADALRARGAPGDVVAYCPDQLGPAVSRLLPPSFVELTFPLGTSPDRVDWVDYAERNKAARPTPFAEMLLRQAGDRDIWVVWSPGYRTVGPKCEALIDRLQRQRPDMQRVVRVQLRVTEHPGLVRFPPAG